MGGEDYSAADKGKTFNKGGTIMMNKKVPMKKRGMSMKDDILTFIMGKK